jgi:hypothetical protein
MTRPTIGSPEMTVTGNFAFPFPDTLHSAGVQSLILPAHSLNLTAFAELWVSSSEMSA